MVKQANSTSFKKGHKKVGGFTKGSKHSEQSKKLISNSLYGKRGKLSRGWKGNKAGYTAIHTWVVSKKGKAIGCANEKCLKIPSARSEWASLSGECKRDLNDFVSLCTSCHRRYDNGNIGIVVGGEIFVREKSVTCPKCNHRIIL